MTTWHFTISQGQDMGCYTANTAIDALDAMCRDAGYRDHADAAAQGIGFDGKIVEEGYGEPCEGRR